MNEHSHTKEEILDMLNCELKSDCKGFYKLVCNNEAFIEFYSSMIFSLNEHFCIPKNDIILIIELMDILEQEEAAKQHGKNFCVFHN